jgi:hypothetical protein
MLDSAVTASDPAIAEPTDAELLRNFQSGLLYKASGDWEALLHGVVRATKKFWMLSDTPAKTEGKPGPTRR